MDELRNDNESESGTQASAFDEAVATVRVLLPISHTLTAGTKAQLADALRFLADRFDAPRKPMARTEPDLPMHRLNAMRELYLRGNG
jgi:hypothetical protein